MASTFLPHFEIETGTYSAIGRAKAQHVSETINSIASTAAALEASLLQEQAEKAMFENEVQELRKSLWECKADRDALWLENNALSKRLHFEAEARRNLEDDLASAKQKIRHFQSFVLQFNDKMVDMRRLLAEQAFDSASLSMSDNDAEAQGNADGNGWNHAVNEQDWVWSARARGGDVNEDSVFHASSDTYETDDEWNESLVEINTFSSSLKMEESEEGNGAVSETFDGAIFVGKWQLKGIIGEGSFAEVREAVHVTTGQIAAVEFVRRPPVGGPSSLQNEKHILDAIVAAALGRGGEPKVPRAFEYGVCPDMETDYLVMERLGAPLLDIDFGEGEIEDVGHILRLGHECITCLEQVHLAGFIHRDLKPENFMVGFHDESNVYLADFGLSIPRSYFNLDPSFRRDKEPYFTGTKWYASTMALNRYRQHRVDDLEALSYVLLFLLRGGLPWAGRRWRRGFEEIEYILGKRRQFPVADLCEEAPAIAEYFRYVEGLQPWDEPDYNRMRKIFEDGLNELVER